MKVDNKQCLSDKEYYSDLDERDFRNMYCKLKEILQQYSELISSITRRMSIVLVKNIIAYNNGRKNIADLFDFESSFGPDYALDTNSKILTEAKELTNEASDYLKANVNPLIEDHFCVTISEALLHAALKRRGKGELSLKATEIQAVAGFGQKQAKLIMKRWKTKKEAGRRLYWIPERRKALTILFYKYFDMLKAAREDYENLRGFKENRLKMIKDKYPELPKSFMKKLDPKVGRLGLTLFILDYLSPQFNNSPAEYMERKLIKRRKKPTR